MARQTVLPAEIWLVDDASPDEGRTLAKLYELQQRYINKMRVEVIPLVRNCGPSVARNTGWDASTQEYIAFLDADDAWHPRKLEIQYEWMQAHPEVAMTGHPCIWVRAKKPSFKLPETWRVWQVTPYRLLLSNRFPTRSVMIRRDIPYRFEPAKRHSEDYLLWLQVVLGGYEAWRLELPLAYLFKAPYGESGLSGNLQEMWKGQLDTYWRLKNEKKISWCLFRCLGIYSLAKHIRRKIIANNLRRN